jgi:oligosaccharyltransferase complex subunit delta (ribophorin II)
MRFLHSFVPSLLFLAAGAAQAASWGFDEGTVTVAAKKAEASVKEK